MPCGLCQRDSSPPEEERQTQDYSCLVRMVERFGGFGWLQFREAFIGQLLEHQVESFMICFGRMESELFPNHCPCRDPIRRTAH